MSVSDWSGSFLAWEEELHGLKQRIGCVFARCAVRESAGLFLDGVLSGIERKTRWLMAEQAGLSKPYRIQSLLGRGRWDADALRDVLHDYVVEAIGDPAGVLVVDETGFLKQGKHSVGVSRQYSGTAGRVENSQIGVFLSYASRFGHSLIDRQLYLPKNWAEDPERRRKAGVPDDVAFKTKPEMAQEMIAKVLDRGLPCAWVLGDAVYRSVSGLRRMLEQRKQPYVLSVRSNHCLRFFTDEGFLQTGPQDMADAVEDQDWISCPAGEGSKGIRLYQWVRFPLAQDSPPGFNHWVLVRRSPHNPGKKAYYFCLAPSGTTLAEMAGAAGLRWTIEDCFLRAKDDLGLDHCEARSWHGWHRHMTLVMIAAAFLTKLSADLLRQAFELQGKPNTRSPDLSHYA